MTDDRFVTQEKLLERIDELAERVSLWDGTDPEASSAILDQLGLLRDSWPACEDRERATNTCNRMSRLLLLFEHRLGGDFDHVQTVLIAAVTLLHALAEDEGQLEDAIRRLRDVARGAASEAAQERGGASPPGPDPESSIRSPTPPTGGKVPGAGGDTALFAGDRGFLLDFVSEANEHLEEIDTLLLDLEKDTRSTDSLNGLFRCFHTIKGVADFLGLEDISSLAHGVENLLGSHREHQLACEASTLDVLFEATDLLRGLVDSVGRSIAEDGQLENDPRVPSFLTRLEAACSTEDDSSRGRIPIASMGAPEAPVAPRTGVVAEPGSRAGAPSRARTLAASGSRAMSPPQADSTVELPGPARARERMDLPPTVKVDSRRLDLLLDTIGELVVAVSVANQNVRSAGDELTDAARAQVEKLTRDVQEMGTSLRMIPLLSTFRKMMRLSRDLGKRCRKSVHFSFSGEGTELDRTIVQQIQDPLLHILRNAVDHGLETPEERLEAGKPKVAYVTARAYHKGGSFFIEVADDGRGFDPDRIARKARDAGLLPEGRELSREDLLRLVFEPGFSTAESVTSISGRGVGMDVVKRTVEKLGGSVDVESVPGKGTIITLRLPLTVAMIEGMVIRVGGQRFVVPTLALTRVHQPKPGEIKTVSQRQEFLSCQDKLIPLVRLGHVFGIEGAETEATRSVVIVVEGKGRPVGLLVDELLGQQQIVIKGLGRALQNVSGIAGGAVMPDGKVGLILDVLGILESVHDGRSAHLRAVG